MKKVQDYVATTKPSRFSDGRGSYFVTTDTTNRTFTSDIGDAVEHAGNLLYKDGQNAEEFLIVKVVARVKKKPQPKPVIVTLV